MTENWVVDLAFIRFFIPVFVITLTNRIKPPITRRLMHLQKLELYKVKSAIIITLYEVDGPVSHWHNQRI